MRQGPKGKILILTTNLFLKVIFTHLLMQILIPNPNTFQNSKIISRKKAYYKTRITNHFSLSHSIGIVTEPLVEFPRFVTD